jgi:integrase
MASCGARVGFAEFLKVKDIGEFEKNGCKSILIYSGEKEEYYSFINPETVKAVDEWLKYRKSRGELITGNSWVIPKALDHTKPMIERGIQARIVELIKHIDRGEMIGSRHEISITHGIRKRWNTIAKNTDGVNYNKVEKMFGHSTNHVSDNVYYKAELPAYFKEYEKFCDELAVSEEAILEIELRNKDRIIEATHAEKDDRIKELEERISRFEKFIKI